MDNKWKYGYAPANIYASIIEGRPNGMPAFRGKINDDQAWKLVAYLQALSGVVQTDVATGRDDHMSVTRPASDAMNKKQNPKWEGATP
jgi:cytochrome c oxidase cbb3-type subunit 3